MRTTCCPLTSGYTCTETIHRFVAEGETIATRQELFAWPGQTFQERGVIDMVGQGFISDYPAAL